MARGGPDTARADFFICIGAQPSLDFGGARNPDGQGFAVFGRVIAGMDAVRRIHTAAAEAQQLTPPIRIVSARRKASPAFKPSNLRTAEGRGCRFSSRACRIVDIPGHASSLSPEPVAARSL